MEHASIDLPKRDVHPEADTIEELRTAADAPGLLRRPVDQLRQLAKRLAKGFGHPGLQRTPIKLAVLGGFTTDYLIDMLRLCLFRRGFSAQITGAGYGQMITELMTGGPALATAPDIALLLPTHRDLRYPPDLGSTRAAALAAADEEAEFWAALVEKVGKPTIVLSFDQPPYRVLADLDGFAPAGVGGHARRTNERLFDRLPATATMVDAEALHSRIGPAWHDPYLYTLCKQPFAMSALPEVADTLAAAVVAKAGKARKVLVLDLDNTVWGGVVGDIGKDGLELGPETAEGEAFTAFQSYARALGQRGVILALCSKNNEALAMSAFREHPAMVLKEKDIAAFVINFEEKATNIRRIAETLNVGLESIVFADDNPIERAWVRKQLPEVAVVELPENPACYAAAVEAEKLFPTIALTTEDLARNQSYRAIAVTRAASEQALDMDQFLRDLDPVALLEPVSDGSIDRIVQLIGKTNQFKLNSSIFDAAEIRQRAAYTIALRLRDRLQDYGIVAVAVTSPDGDSLRILNWVMSCRVFSRRLEHAMVDVLTRLARRACGSSIVLDFQLSAKNGLVPGVLKQLGFSETSPGRYAVALDHPTQPHFMKIEHLEVVV